MLHHWTAVNSEDHHRIGNILSPTPWHCVREPVDVLGRSQEVCQKANWNRAELDAHLLG